MTERLCDIFLRSAGVATDSRELKPGAMFFALRGAAFDGNRFAASALANGASCAVVDDPQVAVANDERYVVVDDVLAALQNLAAHHRQRLGIPVLAITGSNGKTTTKELVARVLGMRFDVFSTCGNLNNHIGVPLTLLAMSGETQFGVVEMGASAVGEIAVLCRIAAPDFGIITNIGLAHLEGFGSAEGVRRGKGELYDWLAAHGGTAFVPTDDAVLAEMARERTGLRVSDYSTAFAEGIMNPLTGDYNVRNIATAAAVGRYFGVLKEDVRRAIESYSPDNHRSQLVDTDRNTLVLDCYNANPSSMFEAVTSFAATPSAPDAREKTVILGDMMELGEYSVVEHGKILALLAELSIEDIYLVGAHFTEALRNLPETPDERIRTFLATDELAAYLRANPLADRRILIKGSRSLRLETLVELL
ncbi:MAG: UDP-N-acetylmuramoyl-tripeptide--D-alanyl-D-alanine ligase [Rikenellaceae bacterium]|nr:UDP-N-acetylmuramoyl-tripeptide--D-alanyl-D-alanine ligase [Rikenellaceae bacterium]